MTSDDSLMDQAALQALIAESEALDWDNPVNLVAHDSSAATQEGYPFIGKLLALKAQNFYHVCATLSSVWGFAAPLTVEVLASNKFLFTVPHENLYKRIINQGPWNVRGSLLLLQPWSPALAIDEVKLHLCAFWIQVHDLPLQYMTTRNAIKIGKGIGKILELDTNSTGLIFRKFIRFKIEINTSQPLASGFFMPSHGDKPRWISFQYERLDNYCSSCGLIGHKSALCPAPAQLIPPGKYDRSLRAPSYVSPRLVSKVQQDGSESCISSAASVSNSPSRVAQSLSLESYGQTHGQIIALRNQTNSDLPSPNMFSNQHVDLSRQLVASQPTDLPHNWNVTTQQSQLTSPGSAPLSLLPLKSAQPYHVINEASCRTPSSFLQYSSTSLLPFSFTPYHLTVPSPLHYSRPSLAHTDSLPHSTLHLSPSYTQDQTQYNQPTSTNLTQPTYPHSTHKIKTHAHSRFHPYSTTRPSPTQHLPHAHTPLSRTQPTISLGHITSQNLNTSLSSSPIPYPPLLGLVPLLAACSNTTPTPPKSSISISHVLQTAPHPITVPAIISRNIGKSKLQIDEDDISLSRLKKQRCGHQAFDHAMSILEISAISPTVLQIATPIKGPVYNFLITPLYGTSGHITGEMPLPGYPFASDCSAVTESQQSPTFSACSSAVSTPVSLAIPEESPVRPPPHA
jgi:hypothetical protein